MGKTTTTMLATLALALWACGDNTKVGQRVNCIEICNEAADCVGGDDFDKGDCKDQCNQDATMEAVDDCQNCLTDQDSCSEDLKCTSECSGVLADIVFK